MRRGRAFGLVAIGASLGAVACGEEESARHEDTISACSDEIDNDDDGFVDCDDQDCRVFSMCVSDGGPDSDSDVDTDVDSDTDSDVDSDSDADSDTGSDTEPPGCRGEAWETETIGEGVLPSLAVDAAGHAHVSYFDNTDGEKVIRYATNASGVWMTDDVQDLVDAGMFSANDSSIAIASDGTIRIAYGMAGFGGGGTLELATNESGTWESETIDGEAWAVYPALLLDGDDRASVVYWQVLPLGSDPPNRMRFATNASGGWDVVNLRDGVGGETSMLFDDAGDLHFASGTGFGDEVLRYGTNASGAWVLEDVDEGLIPYCSLAQDSVGRLHLVYDFDPSEIHYAMREGGDWTLDLAIDVVASWHFDDLRIDRGDAMHALYSGPVGAEAMTYVVGSIDGFGPEEVVDGRRVGDPSAVLVVGPDREPHVAYRWAGGIGISDVIYGRCR